MTGAVTDRPMSPATSAQPVLAAESEHGAATGPTRARVLIVEDEYFLALENEAARLAGPRDGIDAAIEIPDRFGIAIIFATALSDRETRERAERAFALGWLSKPYSSDEMLAAVSRAMQLLRDRRT